MSSQAHPRTNVLNTSSVRRTKVLTQGVRQSKRLDPGDHLRKDFRGEGLFDFLIFRELAGDAVLEKVVQTFFDVDDVLAARRESGLQRFHIPIALDLSVFCSIESHYRAGYRRESLRQIQGYEVFHRVYAFGIPCR